MSKKSSYINLNNFNYLSEPVSSLQQIFQKQWQIKSLQISQHGQTGVVFIQTQIGSFVLKMNNQAPINYFFNSLGSLMNVSVPNMITISCYNQIFTDLVYKIQKFCQKDQILSARLRKRMDFPFYQLIEYIPSISLSQIGRNRFQKYQLEQYKLQSIGICIGYDLLTNNSDRFKLKKVWSSTSQGNINNVLIRVPQHYSYKLNDIKSRQNTSISLAQYCFIDHSGYLMDIENNQQANQNFTKYLYKAIQFQQDLLNYLRGQSILPQQFDNLIYQIQLFTKYRLQQNQVKSVIQGIIYQTNKFIQIYQSSVIPQMLNDMYKGNNIKQKQGQNLQNKSNKSINQSNQSNKSNKSFNSNKPKPTKRQEKQIQYWDQYWNLQVKKIKIKHLQFYHLKVCPLFITFNNIVDQACNNVSKNIQKILGHRTQKTLSDHNITNNSRLESQLSKNSINNLQNINNDDNEDNNNDKINQLQNQNQGQKMGIRIKRGKLLEKLQAFKKKNYQNNQNNQDY